MIEEIHIRDLGIITDARLPLEPGLSVLTGETGAGKTMVVTALGMLLGNRSDATSVRNGAKNALAEAVIRLPKNHAALDLAHNAGGTVEDIDSESSELLLARTVNASGRSRAHVGGCTAPIGTLADIGRTLVAVHGQSDQLRLKSSSEQRHALDSYAGAPLVQALEEYRGVYERYRAVASALKEMRENARARALEAQTLQGALAEIDAVAPVEGEDEALRVESMKLMNVEALRQASAIASAALSGSEYSSGDESNVLALLDAARTALAAQSSSDEALAALTERVNEVLILATDAASDLASYMASLDSDGPGRLAQVQERRAALKTLTRKYGADIAEVLAWAEESRVRLESLDDNPARLEALENELVQLRKNLGESAQKLMRMRQEAAQKLAHAVSEELTALAMPNASLVVEVSEAEKFSAHGKDSVSFMLAPHKTAVPRPLGKGASGGELSRVMLALEVVLAEVDPVPTFIFDEVDSGVGGKAAIEIGRRLAMLAKHVQVLVVTHLPQVAAFADQHILVLKNDDASLSKVQVLSEEERVVELARMLSGHDQSEAAQEHARELLAAGRQV
ncbi:MAG: DNA repair protein RecN [Rothia sp. (in: high G+C Gram-positive bacteria)]|uniref:DNA repair protein RecN n=1 Tax=Rothia sp. (in: high G+C Gram-positive bacteria) TaxID=1885016 RepID=UPI0026E044CE|nr:DNA repair protein RecN [Rothia sp. (in: high G+C Gram-positive bacteria)]MDO5751011.1 DNA repair protein RecN [Rothia sp. (in: high G+C Gram-positive bacteria)]